MKNIRDYIESGILESYVLGLTTPEEQLILEKLAAEYVEVRDAIKAFSKTLEQSAFANAIAPPITIKPLVIATIDYMERLGKGEVPTFPPLLNKDSKISDYADWLNRPDLALSPDFKDIHAIIIGYTRKATTAIVWISEISPPEVHTDEFEKFLIVEGTCEITIGANVYHLVPGDYLSIPLFESHYVTVTSNTPCKAILQRVAA